MKLPFHIPEEVTLYALPFVSSFLLVVGGWPLARKQFEGQSDRLQGYLDDEMWDDISGTQLAAWSTAGMGTGLVLGYLIFGGFIVPLIVMVIGWKFPRWVVAYKITKHHQVLEYQLEEGLGAVANSMRAGMTFVQAMKDASVHLDNPISGEFLRIVREYDLGKSLDEAIKKSKKRFRSSNYDLAVTAILVSRMQGGNLSETLERIAAFMRETFALDRKIRVLTAEGRFSALIVGLSPLFMGMMMYLGAPDAIEPLFTDPLGGMILFMAIILNVVGFLWIQKITEIEV